MKYDDILIWLQDEKKMSCRSARDVVSRLRRVTKILGTEELNEDSERQLNTNETFDKCSSFIKSQLRRAITLYFEFLHYKV